MSTGILLREHELVVAPNLENSSARWNEFDARDGMGPANSGKEGVNQGSRQTGGSRGVVSLHAKDDAHFHPFPEVLGGAMPRLRAVRPLNTGHP